MLNLILLLQFAKFGVLCFGGGYMIIPMLMDTYVVKEAFFSLDQFGNLISLSQITPGAVSINTATYVGFLKNGVPGALAATIGLVLPTLFLASLAVLFLNKWRDTILIRGILKGARTAAFSMVCFAVLIFMGMSIFSAPVPWNAVCDFLIGRPISFPEGFRLKGIELFVCLFSAFIVYKTKFPITYLLFLAAFFGAVAGAFL